MRRTLFVFPRDLLPAAGGARRRGSRNRAQAGGQGRGPGRARRPTVTPGSTGHAPACSGGWPAPGGSRPWSCASGCRDRGQDRRDGRGGPGCRPGPDPPGRDRRHRPWAATPSTGGSRGRGGPLMEDWLAEAPRPLQRRGGIRRAGPSLAGHLRPGHRGRPGVVAGGDQGRRTPGAGRRGRGRGVLGPRRHRLGAPRRPGRRCPTPGPWVALLPVLDPTVMGWKERGFYLGPMARLVRPQRQRGHHRLGGRTDRRLLDTGRRRVGPGGPARGGRGRRERGPWTGRRPG